LNLQAKATEATEEPDGRSVSDLVLDGRRWRCGAGPSDHQGPFRRETGLLVPLGAVRRVPPGLFSLRNAGRWAAYLGNVGLKQSPASFISAASASPSDWAILRIKYDGPGLSPRVRRLRLVVDEFAGPVPVLVKPSFRLTLRIPEQVGPFADTHLVLASHISGNVRVTFV
jgi:hypothetical protein